MGSTREEDGRTHLPSEDRWAVILAPRRFANVTQVSPLPVSPPSPCLLEQVPSCLDLKHSLAQRERRQQLWMPEALVPGAPASLRDPRKRRGRGGWT